MNLETNELIENEVVQIWSNGIQELYKMTLENGYEEISTKTHKYFNEKNEEIELQNLEIGDKVWVRNDENKLYLESIKQKEYFGAEDTYDMEMKEPFRNYIANNIVVHNTGGQNVKRWIMGSGIRIGGGSGGMG
jgi:intein/homing endonuclease